MTFPGLAFSERLTARGFALQLFDGVTGQQELQGEVTATIAGVKLPVEKPEAATFVFLDLAPGNYTVAVRSSKRTPYYGAVDIPLTLPMPDPLWPAYPDRSLADASRPLGDPDQTPAYRAQRALATLRPTPHYPFPPGAALVRGTVSAGTVPLAGATVLRVGDAAGALSDDNGEFVLFFDDVGGKGRVATIRASHPLRPGPVDATVTLFRETAVSVHLVLAP